MSKRKKYGRRIAVLGGNNAGKTVFITSLIDNLQNFDPDILMLNDWCVVAANMTNAEAVDGLDRFPFEKYRNALIADDAKWPEKTFAASIARLNVKLKRTQPKKFWNDVIVRKLEIVDIAGERVADFGMINCDYRQWSVMMTNQLFEAGIDWEKIFNKCTNTSETDYTEAVLAGYRNALVELYKCGANAFITPSTARITLAGQCLGGSSEDYKNALKKHPVGMEGGEFAPLPESAFKDDKLQGLVQKFKDAYEEYRKIVVAPIWSWLKGADDIVYLVDVLGILADGMAAYNAEQALANACFSRAICNKWRTEESTWKKIKEKLKAMKAGLHFSRLIVIATKADLTPNDDRENIKMLAKKLLEKRTYTCSFDKIDYLYCAAVCTSEKEEQAKKGQEKGIPIPEKWDESWDAGKYRFEFAHPPLKRCRKDLPPKNIQMGAIAKKLLEIE